jgi:hypothetical protein
VPGSAAADDAPKGPEPKERKDGLGHRVGYFREVVARVEDAPGDIVG